MKSIIIFLFVFASSCNAQESNQNGWIWNTLLILNQENIPVYENSNNTKIKYHIMNDTLNEEYYLLSISKKENGFFKVKTASAFTEDEISEGWIEPKFVGIFLRARNEIGTVPIYESPNDKAEHSNINSNLYNLVNVIEIKDGWLKIQYKENDSVRIGWLKHENQCSNPYSTCN